MESMLGPKTYRSCIAAPHTVAQSGGASLASAITTCHYRRHARRHQQWAAWPSCFWPSRLLLTQDVPQPAAPALLSNVASGSTVQNPCLTWQPASTCRLDGCKQRSGAACTYCVVLSCSQLDTRIPSRMQGRSLSTVQLHNSTPKDVFWHHTRSCVTNGIRTAAPCTSVMPS
jgi:hypothetical protein